MLHLVSSFVLVVIGAGLYFRRNPNLHWRFMGTAFVLDLGLVLYIEFSRAAVEKVVTEGKGFIWFHAGISLGVLVLYFAMLGLGRKLLLSPLTTRGAIYSSNTAQTKNNHRNLGIAFCVLRLLNYVTALMM